MPTIIRANRRIHHAITIEMRFRIGNNRAFLRFVYRFLFDMPRLNPERDKFIIPTLRRMRNGKVVMEIIRSNAKRSSYGSPSLVTQCPTDGNHLFVADQRIGKQSGIQFAQDVFSLPYRFLIAFTNSFNQPGTVFFKFL